jgi:hypothetical protein
VALRIGFDLDGVLADMEAELVRQAQLLFGEPMTRRLAQRADDESSPAGAADGESRAEIVPSLIKLDMTARQQQRLWHHVESIENFWETLNALEPGVVERLAKFAVERRWEIIFLTKRPQTAGATAQVQSQRWLMSQGFPLPSVYVVQGSRGLIAAALALDVVVDDRPENCLDVVLDSQARAILVWRDDLKQLPTATNRVGIGVVRTVAECLDILAEVDPLPAQEEPGVIDRMKRLLGLKEPASA